MMVMDCSIKQTVDELIELTLNEIREYKKLSNKVNDFKLKEVIANNIDALNDIYNTLLVNYDRLINDGSPSLADAISLKGTVLEYRHIRLNVLTRFY